MTLPMESNLEQLVKSHLTGRALDRVNSFLPDDWKSLFGLYAFIDIESYLQNTPVSDQILKALEGIVLDQKKSEEEFLQIDSLLHNAATFTPYDSSEKIDCIRVYVHILIDNRRFYHAENVLKFEIRSADVKLRTDTKFRELYFLLGFVLLEQYKSDESIEAFNTYAISIKENELEIKTRALRYLGSAWYSKGNQQAIKNATELYEATISLKINNVHSLIASNNLANFYINEHQQGDISKVVDINVNIKKAEEIFKNLTSNSDSEEKGRFRSPQQRFLYNAILLDTKATFKIIRKKYSDALKDLKSALVLIEKTSSSPSPIYYHHGMVYYFKKEIIDAISFFNLATEYGPKLALKSPYLKLGYVSKAFDALGIIYLEKKNLSNAKKNFQKAVEFDPQNHIAKHHLETLEILKQSPPDWFDWWTRTNGKKIGLGILCIGIFFTLIFPFILNDFMTEKTIDVVSTVNTKDISETIKAIEKDKTTTTITDNTEKSPESKTDTTISESVKSTESKITDTNTIEIISSEKITYTDEKIGENENTSTKDTVTTIPSDTIVTTTKTSYKYSFSETQLAFVGILVFIILLPNIKTFKAAGIEIETKDLTAQDQGQPIITHPLL